MAMPDIFGFDDPIKYLQALIASSEVGRGFQGRLAVAAGCKPSYMSQALKGEVMLTMDHAMGLSRMLNHDRDETRYFLELVALSRAGTEALREWHGTNLKQLRSAREDFAHRFERIGHRHLQDVGAYYAAWYWSAVHVALSVPTLRTVDALTVQLGLPKELIVNVLNGLNELGLAVCDGDEWRQTQRRIHLPKDSAWTTNNHFNWRHKAIEDIQLGRSESLHFTGIHSLSRKDVSTLRNILFRAIEAMQVVVNPSPEEQVVCFTADLFPVGSE